MQHRAVYDYEPLAAVHLCSRFLHWDLVYPRSRSWMGFPCGRGGAVLRKSEREAVGRWEMRSSKCIARTCETQHV